MAVEKPLVAGDAGFKAFREQARAGVAASGGNDPFVASAVAVPAAASGAAGEENEL